MILNRFIHRSDGILDIIRIWIEGEKMTTQNQELVLKYIGQWESSEIIDHRLQNFSDEFENWFNQIPDTAKPIVLKLLDNFYYYSHAEANKYLIQLHERLVNEYSILDDDTIYLYIKSKDGISNSSNDYWTEYKLNNKINRNICIENPNIITDEQWNCIHNIVFIDDCCGTGKSFMGYLSKDIDKYRGKKVYFVSIHIMDNTIKTLEHFAEKEQLEIILINAVVQQKAFSSEHFNDQKDEAKQIITDASTSFGIPENHILGFDNSESLMAFYNNTPNNTLGIIRYDVENKYKSIFPRNNDKKPSWQMLNKAKKSREAKNYNAVTRGISND